MIHISFLKENFNVVEMEQVLDALDGKCELKKNACLLTFDDGYSDHYQNVFPLLANRKIPGFFSMPGKILREKKMLDVNKIHYILAGKDIRELKQIVFDKLNYYRGVEFDIPSNDFLYETYAKANRFDDADTIFVKRILQNAIDERLRNTIVDQLFADIVSNNEAAFVDELYLSYDQIKLMKNNGMYFGLHGYEHYWFDKLTETEYINDINKALDVFDGIIDRNEWVFCYPYGAQQKKLLEYCKSINCVAGLTVEARTADLSKDNPMLIPRYDTNDYPPKVDVPKSLGGTV